MFPSLDEEVIEAVLRANDGAVDATIDQLLTMTLDSPEQDSPSRSESPGPPLPPAPPIPRQAEENIYMNQSELMSAAAAIADSSSDEEAVPDNPPPYQSVHPNHPPSYNDYANMSASGRLQSPKTDKASNSVDDADALLTLGGPDPAMMFHSSEPEGATASPVYGTVERVAAADIGLFTLDSNDGAKQSLGGFGDEETISVPSLPPQMSLLRHSYTCTQSPLTAPPPALTESSRYRRWDPPMLGTLPDDFLRIQLTPEQKLLQEPEVGPWLLGPLFLTWFNLNPSMDKWSHLL